MSTEQITEQALALPPEEREKLADLLYLTLDHSPNEEIELAWMEEAEKRLDRFNTGEIQSLDGPTVIEQIKRSRVR